MSRARNLAVSAYVARWAAKLSCGSPCTALDLPCGGGRHSLLLAELGYQVVATDLDPQQLAKLRNALVVEPAPSVALVRADATMPTPFPCASFALIVTTHFVCPEWLRQSPTVLRLGGHLIYETYGGHGENWRALPRAGDVAAQLADHFDLVNYRERACGPPEFNAVTVKVVARRR